MELDALVERLQDRSSDIGYHHLYRAGLLYAISEIEATMSTISKETHRAEKLEEALRQIANYRRFKQSEEGRIALAALSGGKHG